ncbi:hypothetical protein DAPPUDRAFT_332209 [Daphnia pulex]|uniref:Uncharacterized protein n=1 Tax=Daphnia pulex TaxID=6669 RepID=E9HPA8_DAPPU|nr:hypothetical protein DAPPUDRAFT_332209 [Daphnia pulex]|eukprot:EFX66441.1 hypothetical protein DAPPUDRAFT_332209 [Daphnia pulex]
MEGYTLNPAKCVAFFTSLVAVGCIIGLVVMGSTMHQCPTRPPCPTNTDSTQKPDLFEIGVGHQTDQQPSFDGNVIEDTTTSITTSETNSQKKFPNPKKIMTMDIKPNLIDDFQSSSDTTMETILVNISQETPSTDVAETMSPDFQSSSDTSMETILVNISQETPSTDVAETMSPDFQSSSDTSMETILVNISQETPSTDVAETMAPDFQSSSDSKMETILVNILQETPSTTVDEKKDDEIISKFHDLAAQIEKAREIFPEIISGAKTLAVILEQILQEMPATDNSDELSTKIINFTEEMKRATNKIVPEVMDKAKTLTVDFVREVEVDQTMKKQKSYTMTATFFLSENVITEEKGTGARPTSGDGLFRTNLKPDESIIEQTTGTIEEMDIEKSLTKLACEYKMDIKEEAVGLGSVDIVDNTLKEHIKTDSSVEPKYKMDIKEEAVGLGSVDIVDNTLKEHIKTDSSVEPKYKMDIKEEAVGLGSVDIVDNTLKEHIKTDSSVEPKYKMDIKEEAVGLGSVDIVDNTLKEHIKTDSSVEPKYKMDIKEEAVGLGSVDIVDNTLKETTSTALTVVDPSSPAVQSGSTKK